VRDALKELGLPPDEPATPAQAKAAYLRKLREHPAESDPDGHEAVRAAYEQVKAGYEPAAATGDEVVRQFEEHVRSNRLEHDPETEAKLDRVVAEALDHLSRGDVASARACVTATRIEVHRSVNDHGKAQYVGLREILEHAFHLPATAVPAFARALRDYEPHMPSAVLIEYRQDHPRDARRAFRIVRASTVLRELVVLVEPRHRVTPRIPTWAAWGLLVLIVLLLGRVLTET
jgi:hypothetical protein